MFLSHFHSCKITLWPHPAPSHLCCLWRRGKRRPPGVEVGGLDWGPLRLHSAKGPPGGLTHASSKESKGGGAVSEPLGQVWTHRPLKPSEGRPPSLGPGVPVLAEGTGSTSLLVFPPPHSPLASSLRFSLSLPCFSSWFLVPASFLSPCSCPSQVPFSPSLLSGVSLPFPSPSVL